MSARLNKVIQDIEKTETTLKNLQEKLKALQRERLDLENLAMVDYLRKHKIHHNDLKTIVEKLHGENGISIPLKTTNMEVETNEKV